MYFPITDSFTCYFDSILFYEDSVMFSNKKRKFLSSPTNQQTISKFFKPSSEKRVKKVVRDDVFTCFKSTKTLHIHVVVFTYVHTHPC